MIGIIGAMDIEVESIKTLLSDIKTETISGVEFVIGKFSGKDVVVAKCGVGKVFAALCTEAMIIKFSPSVIINVGVAGCLTPELKIGDIAVIRRPADEMTKISSEAGIDENGEVVTED